MDPRLLPFLLLVACDGAPLAPGGPGDAPATPAGLPPETDLPPRFQGEWPLACGASLRLEPLGRLFLSTSDAETLLATEVAGVPAVSADGQRAAWSHAPVARPETVISGFSCTTSGPGEVRVLVAEGGSPDRPALSPDGARLAWVSGASGVASVWMRSWAEGAPVQVTNRDVVRLPGLAPEGFVPPPHRDPPVFETLPGGGARLAWEAADGPVTVEVP